MTTMSRIGTVFAAAAAIASTGCSTHREFRVAEIGSDGSFQVAGDEDSAMGNAPFGGTARTGGTAPTGGRVPLVRSGNLLIGSGSRTTVLGGTVTGTLQSTGQTVVQLASGTSVLLSGVGGMVGDVVAIDLKVGRVVGGPVSLLGTSVLGSAGGTRIAAGGSRGGAVVQVAGRRVQVGRGGGSGGGALAQVGGGRGSGGGALAQVGGGRGSSGGALVQVGGGRGSATSAVSGAKKGAGTLLPANSAAGRVTGAVTNSVTGNVKPVLGKPCC